MSKREHWVLRVGALMVLATLAAWPRAHRTPKSPSNLVAMSQLAP